MKYGVQYYPEHWPRERWTIDADMMRRAGVNIVRMGEFAWSAYEPREGQLDFSWMEEAITLFAEHGIQTILCTCSRTPPPWVYTRYPGAANVWRDGRNSSCDSRYGVGLDHPECIELSQRIDEQVIRQFAGNEHIVAWQIDNEIGCGNDDFSERSLQRFHSYLEEKYGTVEALHDAWGSHFWSFSFSEFSEVPMPKRHPQAMLEYRRFLSASNTAFARWRMELIRELDPGKTITTNFQNLFVSHTDYHDLSTCIDVNGMNHYPSRSPELAVDFNRAARGTVWALEQHTRLKNVDTPAGRMRLWAWMTIAHGADAIVYFRWRQCRWGDEQFSDGLLPHSGEKNRFYAELATLGAELKQLGSLIEETRPTAKVALALSYESRWAVDVAGLKSKLDPASEAVEYHKALSTQVTAIDAVNPAEDLSPYTLVIAPHLWMLNEALATQLKSYVEEGGILCLTAGSGVVDEYGKSFDVPRPGYLSDIAGLTVSDLAVDEDLILPLSSSFVPELDKLQGRCVADELHLQGAEVLATHTGGWRDGLPAITRSSYGKGQLIYVGVALDPSSIHSLVSWLCKQHGIGQDFARPEGISVYERNGKGQRWLFVINWTDHAQDFDPGSGWRDAYSREPVGEIRVLANDLRILLHEA